MVMGGKMKENSFRHENYASVLCAQGDVFRHKNNPRAALKQYLSSIMIKRDNIDAYKGLSLTYKKLKDYERAISCLLKAKEMSQFDAVIYYELGMNYLLNSQVPEASKNLRRAIRLNNKNYNAQMQLAIAHELMGEDELALCIYQKIIEEKPRFIPAYNHKARIYMTGRDYNSALNTFKKILEVNPRYYKAYLGLGICCEKSGYPSKALSNYKKFISLAPSSKNAKTIKERVEMLSKSIREKVSFLRLVK